MTTKKSYSRYFIILQEEEKGYSLASDKLPSGYAKIEMKNDKCKVTYYVQNLKKEAGPYHMILICNKKDVKKVIKLGALNIDDHGRTEVVYEYNNEDIASSGIGVEKVVGAAIVKLSDANIIPVMVGFTTAEPQENWKKYSVFSKEENELVEEHIVEKIEPVLIESIEKPILERHINEEQPKVVVQVEDIKSVVDEPIIKDKETIIETLVQEDRKVSDEIIEDKSIFDYYEEDIESIKQEIEETIEPDAEIIEQNTEGIRQDDKSIEQKTESVGRNTENIMQGTKSIEQNIEDIMQDTESIEQNTESIKQNTQSLEQNIEEKIGNLNRKGSSKKGTIGEYFKMVAKGLEEVEDVCHDIKRCKWYKIHIKDRKDLCDISDYNKYSVIYYPMYSYFKYIKKYKHILLGYKYDDTGKMKYIVFAIPGKRSIIEQPFEGRSGFATWVPLKYGEQMEDSLGYWLMFYDFRNRTIAIPTKI